MIRQVEIGRAYPVVYRPARLPSVAPSMVFEANGQTATVALTAVASSIAVKVTSDITLSAPDGGPALVPGDFRGITGAEAGDAVLDLGAEGGVIPVRIMRVTSDTITLQGSGYRLPHNATGTLHPNVWTGTLASGAVGSAVDRAGRWTVRYTSDDGEDAPGHALTDSGPLRVLRTAFDTGLSEAAMMRDPRLPYHRPTGAFSWREMAMRTLDTLMLDIEAVIGSQTARYADQTPASQWSFAHGLLIVSEMVQAGLLTDPLAPDDSARGRYERELSRTADRIPWIDTDDDGEIDEGEKQAPGFDASVLMFSSGTARYNAIQAGTETQIQIGIDQR